MLYRVGWGRAFSFDASPAVAQFVAADSVSEVFGQDRFNNPPLFSFIDHLVYRATGSQDERLLRVAPIVFGALAVGVLATAVAHRFGALAGHVSGATFAVNALTLRHFREVRGYSLETLAAIAATLMLLRSLKRDAPDSSRIRPLGSADRLLVVTYTAALAVAVGTHLFSLLLVPLHVLVVAGSRQRLRRWCLPWSAAVITGSAIQWPAIVDGLSRPPLYIFAPTFPARLAANLLGGPATIGMLVLVLAGLTHLRTHRWVSWCAIGTVVMVAATWVAGPSWLDSRFFIWLTPATSVAAGAAVARWPRLALVGVAA